MRSLWLKMACGFLGVALLVAAGFAWWMLRTSTLPFDDVEGPSLLSQGACTAYIQKEYGWQGSLQAPAGQASLVSNVTDKVSGEQTLSATFYPAAKDHKPRTFLCTVRPALTGYTVTRLVWQ